jgi:hypothetical protein
MPFLDLDRFKKFHIQTLDFNNFVFPTACLVCATDPKERSAAMQHGAFSSYAASSARGLPAEDR